MGEFPTIITTPLFHIFVFAISNFFHRHRIYRELLKIMKLVIIVIIEPKMPINGSIHRS